MQEARNYEREFCGEAPLQSPQAFVEYGSLVSIYTKRVLSNAEVDAYNGYTRDFNKLNWRAEQEFILDQRFKFLQSCFYEGFKGNAFTAQ